MRTNPLMLSRAEVRAADERAIRSLGLPSLCLMENAGRGLAYVTIAETRRYNISTVIVVAGAGNNGGDGMVAARHLLREGIPVRVLLAAPMAAFDATSDPGTQLRVLRALGISVADASGPDLLAAEAARVTPGTLLVDAVLGTGLDGPVRGHLVEVLRWMGSSGHPVVAADLPSGLDADTGAPWGPAPRCVATATFLAMKPGLLRGEGPARAGSITVCDIGVPPDSIAGAGTEPPAPAATSGDSPREGSPPSSPR